MVKNIKTELKVSKQNKKDSMKWHHKIIQHDQWLGLTLPVLCTNISKVYLIADLLVLFQWLPQHLLFLHFALSLSRPLKKFICLKTNAKWKLLTWADPEWIMDTVNELLLQISKLKQQKDPPLKALSGH